MRVSAKAQYACIAMLELASNYQEPQLLQVKSIAESHGISPRFLVQILLQLKVHGLVRSLRGAAIERIALSLVQLGNDSDDLTRDIATRDTAMEKLRSLVDGERAKNTLDRVESLRGELSQMRSDAQGMRNILSDLENPMIQISLQLECIQDGLDSKSIL